MTAPRFRSLVVITNERPMGTRSTLLNQCRKPTGWLGRLFLWGMNSQHSKLTDWGLGHISIKPNNTILDVGCGGGRTVSKLAATATGGKVYGIDYSEESVTAARKTNTSWIKTARVEIRQGSVSQLPFSDEMFDLVTAVETHFFWPDLTADMREVLRVLKPGGTLVLIAEVYKGSQKMAARLAEKHVAVTGMTLLTLDEHRDLFVKAGYSDVRVIAEDQHGWLCAIGKKPARG